MLFGRNGDPGRLSRRSMIDAISLRARFEAVAAAVRQARVWWGNQEGSRPYPPQLLASGGSHWYFRGPSLTVFRPDFPATAAPAAAAAAAVVQSIRHSGSCRPRTYCAVDSHGLGRVPLPRSFPRSLDARIIFPEQFNWRSDPTVRGRQQCRKTVPLNEVAYSGGRCSHMSVKSRW